MSTFTAPRALLLALTLLSCAPYLCLAAGKNITVDDTDSQVVYSGSGWGNSAHSDLDNGGTHHVSGEDGATATFKFTGTAIYVLSPKWPYKVTTKVQFDGGQAQTIDLTDRSKPETNGGSETTGSSVVWSKTGLQNKEHTIVLSKDDNYVVADGFIYTKPDSSSSTSSSTGSSPSSSGNSSSSSDSSSSSSKTIGIAAGAAVGGIALLGLIAALFIIQRRKQRKAHPIGASGFPDMPSFSSAEKGHVLAPQFGPSGGMRDSGYSNQYQNEPARQVQPVQSMASPPAAYNPYLQPSPANVPPPAGLYAQGHSPASSAAALLPPVVAPSSSSSSYAQSGPSHDPTQGGQSSSTVHLTANPNGGGYLSSQMEKERMLRYHAERDAEAARQPQSSEPMPPAYSV